MRTELLIRLYWLILDALECRSNFIGWLYFFSTYIWWRDPVWRSYLFNWWILLDVPVNLHLHGVLALVWTSLECLSLMSLYTILDQVGCQPVGYVFFITNIQELQKLEILHKHSFNLFLVTSSDEISKIVFYLLKFVSRKRLKHVRH